MELGGGTSTVSDNIKISLTLQQPKDEQEKEGTQVRLVARSCLPHVLWGPEY